MIETAHHPELVARGSFEHLKLGRKPKSDRPTLEFKHYIDEAVLLPQIPGNCDWTAKVSSWPMYGNDQTGDCTCAAVGHMIQALAANAGSPKTPADSDIMTAYWETGQPPSASGIPGGATDDGRCEFDVLNYWRDQGVGSDKIDAWISVDPSNLDHVRAALYLFGGVYTGIALPQTAQNQAVWDVVSAPPASNQPGSWGGHAVPYEAYDSESFVCVTWGALHPLTVAFHSEYTDEVYAILSADFFNGANAPNGISLDDLKSDFIDLMQEGY